MDISDLAYREVVGTEDFQHVVSISLGSGYDWDDLEAWYSPGKRRFFWAEGSGCSCSWLGDHIYRIEDLTSGNREELVNAVRRKYADGYNVSTEALLIDLATVKKFRQTR